MEAYMEDMVYQKQTDVETQIKNTARESILAIQRQESAIRDAKRVLAGYGIFDSLDEAYLYVKENAASSDYPLYITKEEDHKYHVKEHILKDEDEIPIHNGDTLFCPDNTFFQIQFHYKESKKINEKEILDRLFVRLQKIENCEEYFPKCYEDDHVFSYSLKEKLGLKEKLKGARLRSWTEEEKNAVLNRRMDEQYKKATETFRGYRQDVLFGAGVLTGSIFIGLFSHFGLKAWFPFSSVPNWIMAIAFIFFLIGFIITFICFSDFVRVNETRKHLKKEIEVCKAEIKSFYDSGMLGHDEFQKFYAKWKD